MVSWHVQGTLTKVLLGPIFLDHNRVSSATRHLSCVEVIHRNGLLEIGFLACCRSFCTLLHAATHPHVSFPPVSGCARWSKPYCLKIRRCHVLMSLVLVPPDNALSPSRSPHSTIEVTPSPGRAQSAILWRRGPNLRKENSAQTH